MSQGTIVVTGAAGFIGSNIVKALNSRGISDVIAVDDLSDGTKFANLSPLQICDYWDYQELHKRLSCRAATPRLRAILHQGACSETTEWDGRYMMRVNYTYSRDLLEWCQSNQVPLVYASSAAVYGGSGGFGEARENERPLNVYGYSKLLFDNRVRYCRPRLRSQVVGLRYFNVYGPGESHKGTMASVVWHLHRQLQQTGKVKLFEGSHGYGPGEQRRDFVFVDDVAAVVLWFLERAHLSGSFNVGTGISRSFNDVAAAIMAWHGVGELEYIGFPDHLKGRYQAFTEADIGALRETGLDREFVPLEEGVRRYLDEQSRELL